MFALCQRDRPAMYGLLPQGLPQFLLEAIDFGGLPYHVAPRSTPAILVNRRSNSILEHLRLKTCAEVFVLVVIQVNRQPRVSLNNGSVVCSPGCCWTRKATGFRRTRGACARRTGAVIATQPYGWRRPAVPGSWLAIKKPRVWCTRGLSRMEWSVSRREAGASRWGTTNTWTIFVRLLSWWKIYDKTNRGRA